MRPFALCIVALAWSAGASLAHAQVDFDELIDSLTGPNGAGEANAPSEESSERSLEPAAPAPSDEAEGLTLDQLDRPEDDRPEVDAPESDPAPAPRLEQGENRIPDRVDLRALVDDAPEPVSRDRVPSLEAEPAAWGAPPAPAGYYRTGYYGAGSEFFPADPIRSYRTPPCFRGAWAGFAAERAARCQAHHKCLHGTCDCFVPRCAPPLAPR